MQYPLQTLRSAFEVTACSSSLDLCQGTIQWSDRRSLSDGTRTQKFRQRYVWRSTEAFCHAPSQVAQATKPVRLLTRSEPPSQGRGTKCSRPELPEVKCLECISQSTVVPGHIVSLAGVNPCKKIPGFAKHSHHHAGS